MSGFNPNCTFASFRFSVALSALKMRGIQEQLQINNIFYLSFSVPQEIDCFVKEFLSVVQKLPSCIATLQTISHQPVPSGLDELKEFCSVNEARFQQLRW